MVVGIFVVSLIAVVKIKEIYVEDKKEANFIIWVFWIEEKATKGTIQDYEDQISIFLVANDNEA